MIEKKRVLFLAQHFITLYSFRRELIERLCYEGYEVYLSLPESEDNVYFEKIGCRIVPTKIDRRGVNPLKDLKLILFYRKMIYKVDPDIIFSYTIKPNIYGCLASNGRRRKNGQSFVQVCNITGTGGTFLDENFVARVCRFLYRHSIRKCYKVFFQNEDDLDLFIKNGMVKANYDLLPGSGVNLEQFQLTPMEEGEDINFIYIGRVMRLKGIDELLEAAKRIKEKYSNTHFYIAGFVEEGEYKDKIKSYSDVITELGFQKDISKWIKKCHCTILPSHGGEGVPNVLLESAAMGRICIGSNVPGTKEVIDNNNTGFLFEAGNTDALEKAIEKVVLLSKQEKIQMGVAGRKLVEEKFDRNIVIEKYMHELEKV